MNRLVIGLDAAAQLENCGYAIGRVVDKRVVVEDAGMLERGNSIERALGPLVGRVRSEEEALIAIDAPLGWPRSMGCALAEHRAGEKVCVPRTALFKRRTDDLVRDWMGKTPLEVGADKIAHASHHALELLEALRRLTDCSIPLAWSPEDGGIRAIEVYPGATLLSRFDKVPAYKAKTKEKDRVAMKTRLELAHVLENEIAGLEGKSACRADVFDACLCLLAAKDFLQRLCKAPDDMEVARKEGWIWVRPRDAR